MSQLLDQVAGDAVPNQGRLMREKAIDLRQGKTHSLSLNGLTDSDVKEPFDGKTYTR